MKQEIHPISHDTITFAIQSDEYYILFHEFDNLRPTKKGKA